MAPAGQARPAQRTRDRGWSAAKILVAPVLAFITVQCGWRAAIVSLSFLGLAWIVCWLLTWTEGPFTAVSEKNSTKDAATHPSAGTEPNVPWRKIFLSRTFLSCCLPIITVFGLTTVVLTWLLSYYEVGRLHHARGRLAFRPAVHRRPGTADPSPGS